MVDAGVSGPAHDRLVRSLWLLSALFIVYGTTLPFSFDGTGHVAARLAHLGLTTPWALHEADRLSIPDVVQNILLFVPFGALGYLSLRRGGRSGVVTLLIVVTAAGALLSAGVEVLQLFTVDRITSLTDLGTNSGGAAAGALTARLGRGLGLRVIDTLARARLLDSPTVYPMLVFLGLLCLSAWQPFDVTLDVGTVGHKVRLLLQDPWQFNGVDDEGIALLQAALFAGALAAWLDAVAVRAPCIVAAILAAALSVGLEGSQVFIAARQPGLSDALLRTLGAIVGASLWAAAGGTASRGLLRPAVALTTAAGVALQMLSPFHLAPHYQQIQWVPFLSYYANTSFNTVSHTIELLLLYLPLGFAIGWSGPRGRYGGTMRGAALLALAMSAPIEYAQGWIVGRYPDVTDVALSIVGACVGVWVATEGAAMFQTLAGRDAARPARP